MVYTFYIMASTLEQLTQQTRENTSLMYTNVAKEKCYKLTRTVYETFFLGEEEWHNFSVFSFDVIIIVFFLPLLSNTNE